MFEWIEEIYYKNIKIKIHFLGYKGSFTVLASNGEISTIAKGITIQQAKKKALRQLDTYIS